MVAQARGVANEPVQQRSAFWSRVFPIVGKKFCDIAITSQSADGHMGSMRNSHRFNARTIDPVKVPDESENFGKSAQPMRFAGLERAQDDSPNTVQPGTLEPNHQRGAR